MLDLETTATSPEFVELPYMEVVYDVTNSFSLAGQIFILVTYFSIRKKSSSFYAYVACHSFIELPWLITNYLTIYYGKTASAACTTTAFINIFSYVASMIWGSVIAGVIYSALKNKQKILDLKWYYPLLAIAVAFLFVLYALIIDGYGPYAGSGIQYCWFNSDASTVSYWVPFILTTVFNLYCYVRSIYIVKTQATGASKDFWSLLIFPMIQIICNIGGIVKIIMDAFTSASYTYSTIIEIILVVLAKSQGLFEAMAYLVNRNVRGEILKVWCKRRQKQSTEVTTQLTNTGHSFNMESLQTERTQRMGPLIL